MRVASGTVLRRAGDEATKLRRELDRWKGARKGCDKSTALLTYDQAVEFAKGTRGNGVSFLECKYSPPLRTATSVSWRNREVKIRHR